MSRHTTRWIAARAAFLAQSQPLLDASRILGSGPWRTFCAVGLPMARPAIAAGAALALFEALADFAVELAANLRFETGGGR